MSRFAVTVALSIAVAAFAGAAVSCSDNGGTGGGGGNTGGSGGDGGSTGGSGGSSAAAGGEGGTSADEPYANVVAVMTSGADGAYTFNVSVESADVDCTEFANWWEVLSDDGTLIYRRILEHSHTDENGTSDPDAPGNTFTRSGNPVAISADDAVYVRAHMSTGGYRGIVVGGTVAGGFAEATDLSPDFAADVEDDEPQPDACQF